MSISCNTTVFPLDTVNSLSCNNAKKTSSNAVANSVVSYDFEHTEETATTSCPYKGKVIDALMSLAGFK